MYYHQLLTHESDSISIPQFASCSSKSVKAKGFEAKKEKGKYEKCIVVRLMNENVAIPSSGGDRGCPTLL